MRMCPKCGKENSNNSKYCNNCGEVLIDDGKKAGVSRKTPIFIIGALVGVLLLAGGIFFLKGKDDNNANKDEAQIAEESPKGELESEDTAAESEESQKGELESEEFKRRSEDPMALTDSWTDIIEAGRDGSYIEKYRVGDTKELDLGTEGIITMKLVAMDADELTDGSGCAPMTWIAEDLLNSEHVMNTEDTIEGGWPASDLRKWLRTSVFRLIPEEVRAEIKEVRKYSYSYTATSSETVPSSDTIWIPSCREIYGADGGDEDKGTEYSKAFPDEDSWKRSHLESTEEAYWFLRSARLLKNGTKGFIEGSKGSPQNSPSGFYELMPSNEEHGIVIGFCL